MLHATLHVRYCISSKKFNGTVFDAQLFDRCRLIYSPPKKSRVLKCHSIEAKVNRPSMTLGQIRGGPNLQGLASSFNWPSSMLTPAIQPFLKRVTVQQYCKLSPPAARGLRVTLSVLS